MSSEHLNLHIIPGISASGKTTMARYVAGHLNSEGRNAAHVVPHTTRPPRPGEAHGIDYYFHTPEGFLKHRSENPPDSTSWRYSHIGGHDYFNSDEATLPTDQTPVKILPAAFGAVREIVTDYSDREDIRISIAPIIISPEVSGRWLQSVWVERPHRDLQAELAEQQLAYDSIVDLVDTVFMPSWLSRRDDFESYFRLVRNLLT